MDYIQYKTLTNKTHRIRNRKRRKYIKIILYVLIIFFILLFVRTALNTLKSFATHDVNLAKQKVKNSDEYYYNLVDKYCEKIDNAVTSDIINSYTNLGIVSSNNGYINFRSEPNENNTRSIIGLLNDGDAIDILQWDLDNNSIYCKAKSGDMVGYVSKSFILTGDEAKEKAKKNLALRAVILVDKLRIRSETNTTNDNIIGTTYKGDRYKIISIHDDWLKINVENDEDLDFGYINANSKYVEVRYCLSEAKTQDLKTDVLNYYDNIGVSTARDYINVRKSAATNGTIIGKLPGKAGCDIIGEKGNFYKIKSGKVTGYVSKKYLATGKKAEDLALQYADLRAIIKIAALKVRSGPSQNSKQWTTIRKEETYIVLNQLDGWVEIEVDEGSDKGYISTQNNYVEVRYALDQAIEFHPVTANVSSTRTKLKNTALKYIGGKYVWGGNSLSSGVDCSGFVQQIFKIYGVNMKRTARDQAKQGTEVSKANIKVGDLVFYANSSGVVDHVAIYIGNNQVVHAASTKSGIKISSWDYRTPKTIRNVLGNK